MNAIVTQLDPKIIESLVLNGDVGKLTPGQKLQYVAYRCKQVGLDPAAQPFQLLRLQGKEVLYATAGATQQLCQSRGLSVAVTSREKIEDIYCVTARVTGPDNRVTENMGTVSIGGLKGEALANAMLKTVTKAIRRSVLAHCGLGMLDETEVETIPGAQPVRGNPMRFEYANIADEIEACGDREQLDAFWESVGKEFQTRAGAHAAKTSGIDYGETAYERYLQKRDKLPERKEDKRARVQSTDEYPNAAQSSAVVAPAAPPQGAEAVRSPPESSLGFEIGETASRILDMIDIAETADDMKAIVAASTKAKEEGELTAEEAETIQRAYKARRVKLKEAA